MNCANIVHGGTCRAEIVESRMHQWDRLKKKKRERNLKFLVPNTNGPFVGNPMSMVYECLFLMLNMSPI